MRRMLLLTAVAMLVTTVAFAANDPWRVRVTDLDPNAPHATYYGASRMAPSTLLAGDGGAWGTNGGTFNWYSPGRYAYPMSTYEASTGTLTFTMATRVSTDIQPAYSRVPHCILKLSASLYKGWGWGTAGWGNWNDVRYTTSTDGFNFAIPSTNMLGGGLGDGDFNYDFPFMYRTTGGVYVASHTSNGGPEGTSNGSYGIMTSGVGESIWVDIDNATGADYKDPIIKPRNLGTRWRHCYWQDGNAGTGPLCDGNLGFIHSVYPQEGYRVWQGQGIGLVIGTAGETCGGNEYIYLADPASNNTVGVGPSLLSWINMTGLSGPSLRSNELQWYENPYVSLMKLQPNLSDSGTKFVVFYQSWWDTDSSGDGYTGQDLQGTGIAHLGISRNKADFNYDGTVSSQDLLDLSAAYGSSSGQGNFNPDCDMNGDGQVSSLDLLDLSTRYGTDCSFSQ